MASDGQGGFWITWEEFSDAFDTVGEIRLAHWKSGTGWLKPKVISPPGFMDLPSPLPGFVFRNNSFPMIASPRAGAKPSVVWTSYDTGVGRCYQWVNGSVSAVSDTGGDQFFPAIAFDSSGVAAISYSQTDPSNSSYDRYLVHGGPAALVSTASSFPNSDPFFLGQFIGDYEAIVAVGEDAHPIWTDLRGPSFEQNAMVFAH
jgi:hypothetical protein